jgi:hypothetical protein
VAPEDRAALIGGLAGKTVLDLSGVPGLSDAPGAAYQGLCW